MTMIIAVIISLRSSLGLLYLGGPEDQMVEQQGLEGRKEKAKDLLLGCTGR